MSSRSCSLLDFEQPGLDGPLQQLVRGVAVNELDLQALANDRVGPVLLGLSPLGFGGSCCFGDFSFSFDCDLLFSFGLF